MCVIVVVLFVWQRVHVGRCSDVAWYGSVWATAEPWHSHVTLRWRKTTRPPHGSRSYLTWRRIYTYNALSDAAVMDAFSAASSRRVPSTSICSPLWPRCWLLFCSVSHWPFVGPICSSTLWDWFSYGLCKRYFWSVLFCAISWYHLCSVGLWRQRVRTSG